MNNKLLKKHWAWIGERLVAIALAVLLPLTIFCVSFGGDVANSLSSTFWDSSSALVALALLVGGMPLAWLSKVLIATTLVVIFLHILEGVKSIVHDHIHNPKTEMFTMFSLKRVQIELFKHIFIFVFF